MTTKKNRNRNRGNGEGTIYYSEAKGKWIAQYTVGTDASGKQHRKTFYADSRRDVKNKLEKYIAELTTGTAQQRESSTIYSISKYLIDSKYEANIVSDNTYHRSTETLKQIEGHYFSQLPIQKVTSADIKAYLKSITDYSNSVISKNYMAINGAYKYAIAAGIVYKNPLDNTKDIIKPKSKKKTKKISALTVDEQREVTAALTQEPKPSLRQNDKYRMQMLISMYTGMRMGEVNALTRDNIDIDKGTITITRTLTRDKSDRPILGTTTKTYAGLRTIVLNDYIKGILSAYLNDKAARIDSAPNKLLFWDSNARKYITTNQVNMQFKRLCESLNISRHDGVNQHMLRHTFATRSIEGGCPAKVLQKILGHADIKTTLNTYCDVFESFERDTTSLTYDYLLKQNIIPKKIS